MCYMLKGHDFHTDLQEPPNKQIKEDITHVNKDQLNLLGNKKTKTKISLSREKPVSG